MRKMLRGKIHRATVTEANLDYEGSVTIDQDLLDAADLLPGEAISVWNVTNGERFDTYTLSGPRGSGVICINGAAAHKATAGDLVILAGFAYFTDAEARAWEPKAVFVDADNCPVELRAEQLPQG